VNILLGRRVSGILFQAGESREYYVMQESLVNIMSGRRVSWILCQAGESREYCFGQESLVNIVFGRRVSSEIEDIMKLNLFIYSSIIIVSVFMPTVS